MKDYIKEALTEWYGERCEEYEAGCIVCEAWKQYDEMTTQTTKDYWYIGKDGKRVLAKDLEDERDSLREELLAMKKKKELL